MSTFNICNFGKLKYGALFIICIIVVTSIFLEVTASASAYDPGFEWKKSVDYTNGTTNNSTVGNPNLDQLGNPAWSYEYFNGPSANFNSGSQMQWDGWRWVAGGGFVNVSKWDQNTQLNTNWNNTGMTSLVRWINPTGESINVDLTGKLRTIWGGVDWDPSTNDWEPFFRAAPSDVRVVLGYYDFSEGSSSLLIDNTYSSPINGETICNTFGECPYIDTSLDRTLSVDAGDSLFWTTIALGSSPGKNRWLTTNDGPVSITMVPEPGSYALFIVGVSALGIRRFWKNRRTI